MLLYHSQCPALKGEATGTSRGSHPAREGRESTPSSRKWESKDEEEVVKQRWEETGKEKLCAGKENCLYEGLKRSDSTFQGAEETSGKVGRKTHGRQDLWSQELWQGFQGTIPVLSSIWLLFSTQIALFKEPVDLWDINSMGLLDCDLVVPPTAHAYRPAAPSTPTNDLPQLLRLFLSSLSFCKLPFLYLCPLLLSVKILSLAVSISKPSAWFVLTYLKLLSFP